MELVRKYITQENLQQQNRKREKVYTRYYLYQYLREGYNMSLQAIGQEFKRDHATILHGLREYKKFKDDKYFINTTSEVRKYFTVGVYRAENITASCAMFQILGTQNNLIKDLEVNNN